MRLAASLPTVVFLLSRGASGQEVLVHSLEDYVSFVALLTTLYVIASGLVLEGGFRGTPLSNLRLLAIGSVLASLVGTMGASVILVRPLLRANSWRRHRTHQVVFFILLVSNVGGLLTALGDPPLFLGFLRGVPFSWTLKTLWTHWIFSVGALLATFLLWDRFFFARENAAHVPDQTSPLKVQGIMSFFFLALVVLSILSRRAGPLSDLPFGWHELILGLITAAAWATSTREIRALNGFSWGPAREVAILFLGLFLTMSAPLILLNSRSGDLGIREPWHFFWATGLLSSWLDNAPTYLSFASAAAGQVQVDAGQRLFLAQLLEQGEPGPSLLRAVSCGAVLMGAFTYIGNAPNLIVKLIAERDGVQMPSFLGYIRWTAVVLIPLFLAMSWMFMRGAP